MSRKALANKLELTPAALSIITRDMLEEGILVESDSCGEALSGKVGRKEINLDIARSRFYAFGAYIATRDVRVFCMDFNYELKFMKELSFTDSVSGEYILNKVFDTVDGYLEEIETENIVIAGIGIAVKGIVDTERGISVNSFGLWENNLPIYEIAKSRFPYRIVVNNNVKCIAYAESLIPGNNEFKSLLLIKYGPLIGASLVLNSGIYDGSNYRAMEMGHQVIEPNGIRCRCGKKGCLETVIGFDVMVHQMQLLYSPRRVPELFRITGGDMKEISMETIILAYEAGDAAVCDVVDRAIRFFAMCMSNTIGLLNPAKVVLYGRPFQSKKYMKDFFAALKESGCDLSEVCIAESTKNMKEDFSSCISIVIKEFINDGGQS